jgi:hypothetical protein
MRTFKVGNITITDAEIAELKMLIQHHAWNARYLDLQQKVADIGQRVRNTEDVMGIGDGSYPDAKLPTDELMDALNQAGL